MTCVYNMLKPLNQAPWLVMSILSASPTSPRSPGSGHGTPYLVPPPRIRFAGCGLACMFGAQAVINIAVAVRLVPAKGLTLPFISYGGSSLIAGGLALGMLLVFTRLRTQGEVEDILRRRLR